MNLLIAYSILAMSAVGLQGQVLTSTGPMQVVRSGHTQMLYAGQAVEALDQIVSNSGVASLLIGQDSILYAQGPAEFALSDVTVAGANSANQTRSAGRIPAIDVAKGELRVVTETPLTVRSRHAELNLHRGVLRIEVTEAATIVKAEQGEFRIRQLARLGQHLRRIAVQQVSWLDASSVVCREGSSFVVDAQGMRAAQGAHPWDLSPRSVAFRGASVRGRHDLESWARQRSQQICDAKQYPSCANLDAPQTADGQSPDPSLTEPNALDPIQPDANDVATDSTEPPPASDSGAAADGADAVQDYISSFNNAPLSLVVPISTLATASTSFGGNNPDAGQATLAGQVNGTTDPFPGSIHLLTSQTAYAMSGLKFTAAEFASIAPTEYWSIGLGASPTSQVTTSFLTGSNAVPKTVRIPNINAYLLRLDQYGITDPVDNDPTVNTTANVGLNGLLGDPPTSPVISGAVPLEDQRGSTGQFNSKATFALGEFRTGVNADGEFEVAVRRSAQDRKIVKDNNGNDANDTVTTNPEIPLDRFVDVNDPLFQPSAGLVKAPPADALPTGPTEFSQLDSVRRAAATTLVAEKLYDFARRTGQTRFVIDGQLIDISGYRRP